MKRKKKLRRITHRIWAMATWCALVGAGTTADRPNIIVIFMDDMGYNDVGALTYPAPPNQYPVSGPPPSIGPNTDPDIPAPNHARFLTPNIDSLAAEGLMMPQFYVTPLCSLSRASLLTGRYCKRVGVNRVFFPDRTGDAAKGLNTREVTLPELLRQEGYATGMVGKWHLGYVPTEHQPFQMMPTRHGFEEFYGHPHSNDMNFFDLIRNETVLEGDFGSPTEQAQITWRYTEAALDFIERKSAGDQPFFLYFAQIMTHVQCWPSDREFTNGDGTIWPKFHGTSGVSQYYDVVREVDHSVGRVLTKLDQLGIDDETLVIFTSDNGPWLNLADYDRGPGTPDLNEYSVGCAYPLRDGKFTTFEGGVRVPFFARWRGRIAPGAVIDDQVGAVTDLLPTFAGLAGASVPNDRTVDGIDLWPVWSGQVPGTSRAFAHFNSGGTLEALVKDNWKLHTGKLYDLTDLADQETTDHAAGQPAILADLQAEKTAIENSLATETEPLGEFTPYEVQLSTVDVTVSEGGTGDFAVRLSDDPGDSVTVSSAFFSGDSDLSIALGGSLSFNSANWSVWQTVTLAAAQDADAEAGGATFRVTMSGFNVVREIFAFEEDDEAPVAVASSLVWPKVDAAAITDSGVRLVAEGRADVAGMVSPPGTTYAWIQVSGPGTATFSHPDAPETGVAFSQDGIYRIRFVANHVTAGASGTKDFVAYVGVIPSSVSGPEASAVLSYDATRDIDGDAFWENLLATVPGERDWALTPGVTRSGSDPAPSLPFINAAWEFPGGVTGNGATSPHLDAYGDGDASIELWFKPDSLPTASQQVLWETGGNVGTSFTLEGNTLRFAVDDGVSDAATGAIASASLAPLAGQDGFVHCVGVFDLANDQIRLFVDGILADTQAIPAVADWCGVSGSGLGKVDNTPVASAGSSATVDFDPVGELAAQFSGGTYNEAGGVGLDASTAVTLASADVTSFDGPQSASLVAGDFTVGESFTVGAYFKMASFGTGTGLNGQILRLGLTNGGSDNFAFLPFSTVELVNPTTGLAKFVMRHDNAGGPALTSFTLSTGQWYYFETTFTRSGADAVDYAFLITSSSADGTRGPILANDSASNVGGGLNNSTELDKVIYGGFKGHEAFNNGASGVFDQFSVVAGGRGTPVVNFNSLGGNDLLTAPISEFTGQIAVLRFYDQALDASEIGDLADGPAAINIGPTVSAGIDQAADTISGLALVGAAGDDGNPAGSTLTTRWTQTDGPDADTAFPALASFGDASSLATFVNFDVPGEYTLRLEADDSEIKVYDTALTTVSPLGYAQWAAGIAFPAGQETASANPDGDRFVNVWEWALGTDPLQPNPSDPGMTFSTETVGQILRLVLALEVPRDRQADISFYEGSDLQSWTLIPDPQPSVAPVSNTQARWTLRYDIFSAEPRRFLRAAVSE